MHLELLPPGGGGERVLIDRTMQSLVYVHTTTLVCDGDNPLIFTPPWTRQRNSITVQRPLLPLRLTSIQPCMTAGSQLLLCVPLMYRGGLDLVLLDDGQGVELLLLGLLGLDLVNERLQVRTV